jgi:hypothetical protein
LCVIALGEFRHFGNGRQSEAGGCKTFCPSSFLEVTCTSSPQSFGGPRAGETGGGSSRSPRWARIFWIGPGSRTGSPQPPEVAKSAKATDIFALVKQSERDQPDVAATVGALQWDLFPDPRHELGPRNPRGVAGTTLVTWVATAASGKPGEPVQELKRRELDNAVGPWPRGLSRATRADPVGGFVPWNVA